MDKIVDKVTPMSMGYSGATKRISGSLIDLGHFLGRPREGRRTHRKPQWAILYGDGTLRSFHMSLKEVQDVLDNGLLHQVPLRF